MSAIERTPGQNPAKTAAKGAGGAKSSPGTQKSDPFGNAISWQKGDSGEKIKVFYSGDDSKWKSGVYKFEGAKEIRLTVPGTRWVVTIPKNTPENAHADDSFHNALDVPVKIGEKPDGLSVPNALRKEPFAVFDDGHGKLIGIGVNSLYMTTGKAPAPQPAEEPAQTRPQPEPSQGAAPQPAPTQQQAPPQPTAAPPRQTSQPPIQTAPGPTAPPPPKLDAAPGPAAPQPGAGNAPIVGDQAAQAQSDLNAALNALQSVETKASPSEIRTLEALKQQAQVLAGRSASSSSLGDDAAKFLIPNFYSRLILRAAGGGQIQNPAIAGAAQNYLQKEGSLSHAYIQDAWSGVQSAWQSTTPEWQNYYQSRWSAFQGRTPDPWRAFAADVVQNGAPQESAMKAAAQNYLLYDSLRRSNLNPFLYPMAIQNASNAYQKQQFTIPGGQQGVAGMNIPGMPDFMSGLAGAPMVQALYGNIQTSMAQSLSWISNLWGGPPAYFYNSPAQAGGAGANGQLLWQQPRLNLN